ncbi:hypothetical protein M8J76_008893 [Diaphorina citri]|nr:hypothetical protein M8J76_008893 [Diaphorina citri]
MQKPLSNQADIWLILLKFLKLRLSTLLRKPELPTLPELPQTTTPPTTTTTTEHTTQTPTTPQLPSLSYPTDTWLIPQK